MRVALCARWPSRSAGVDVRVGNALAVLAERPADLVSASDLVRPGNFADPGVVVAALLARVRTGGRVALLYSGYCRAASLPGYARLELLAQLASFRRCGLPTDRPHHHDRPLTRLLAAGAVDTAVRVLPRIGFP